MGAELNTKAVQAMLRDVQPMVERHLVTFVHPSTVAPPVNCLMAMRDYSNNAEKLQHELQYYIRQYILWTMEDFGLHYWEKFANAVAPFIRKHCATLTMLCTIPSMPTKMQRLVSMVAMMWVRTGSVVCLKSEDSMLPTGTMVVAFCVHRECRQCDVLWNQVRDSRYTMPHMRKYRDALTRLVDH